MAIHDGQDSGDQESDGTARATPAPLVLGGRYRLDTVIGRGGMGKVWRGHDEQLGRPVAVKVLREAVQDQLTAARFTLEARTAAQLNDPQVVGVYDFGTDRQRFYLVMELVDGRSCAEVLETGGAMSPRRAAALGAQVARGLAAAHAHAVVHRDIKPGNLLLDDQDRIRIADFGIARFTQDTTTAAALTGDGQIMGTAGYVAPEVALGHPATPAGDVYALGCVLYQFLTGASPFHGDVPAATLYQHVHTEPVPPHHLRPEIPVSLSGYVLHLLAKDPDHRPTAAEVGAWLEHWDQEPAHPTRPHLRALPGPLGVPVPSAAQAKASVRRTGRPGGGPLILAGGAAAVVLIAGTIGILGLSGAPTDASQAPTVTPTRTATVRSAVPAKADRTDPTAPGRRLAPVRAASPDPSDSTVTAVPSSQSAGAGTGAASVTTTPPALPPSPSVAPPTATGPPDPTTTTDPSSGGGVPTGEIPSDVAQQ
ncbi:serine/threonine-protein kinase [Streptacidiphilus sp. PAMC 29251]